MKQTQVPGSSLTYLQTFTDRSVNSYTTVTEEIESAWDERLKNPESNDVTFQTRTNELAVVFSQIKPANYETSLKTILGFGATAAGATFTIPFIPKGPTLALVGLATTGVSIYSISNIYQGKIAAAGYCGALTSNNANTREGCSAVQIVPYEPFAINKICKQIEGSP